MPDDRMFAAFRTFDAPLDPDPAFADRLFEDLAVNLGYRPERGLAGLRRRARRALGLDRLPVGYPALRLAYLAALLGLLFALAIGAALVASQLLGPDPGELVRRSQALYADGSAPAFTMTMRYPEESENRFLWDGAGTLRIETVRGRLLGEFPEGSYMLWTPNGQGIYDPEQNTWTQGSEPPPMPLWGLPLNWIEPVPVPAGQAQPTYTCPAWQREPDGTVAGRSVYHLTCGSLGFWIDTETLILLRRDDPQVDQLEAIGFEPGVSAPAEAFALVKPPGAFDPAGRPPSTVLVVGQAAPTLSGPLLGGGTFTSASLLGKPSLVVFWATWCPPCSDPGGALDAVSAAIDRRRSELNVVTVASMDAPADLAVYLAKHPTELPIVLDDDGARLRAWGFDGIPSLVLLDAEGRVLAVHAGRIAPADLEAMVDAALAGRPIPSPAPPPEPTPRPEPTIYTSETAGSAVTSLEIGGRAPEFDAMLVNERGVHTPMFRGRPTALLVVADDCPVCLTMLEDMARAYAAHHEAVNLVALLWGEPDQALMNGIVGGGYRHAVSLGVDGRLDSGLPVLMAPYVASDEFGLTGVPVLVLIDADWRVVGVRIGPLAAPDIEAAIAGLSAQGGLQTSTP